jgi:uncharacterized membrane protein
MVSHEKKRGGCGMNFITQLGVLAVILIILMIIIKSNQTLEEIYMEDREEKNIPWMAVWQKRKGSQTIFKNRAGTN